MFGDSQGGEPRRTRSRPFPGRTRGSGGSIAELHRNGRGGSVFRLIGVHTFGSGAGRVGIPVHSGAGLNFFQRVGPAVGGNAQVGDAVLLAGGKGHELPGIRLAGTLLQFELLGDTAHDVELHRQIRQSLRQGKDRESDRRRLGDLDVAEIHGNAPGTVGNVGHGASGEIRTDLGGEVACEVRRRIIRREDERCELEGIRALGSSHREFEGCHQRLEVERNGFAIVGRRGSPHIGIFHIRLVHLGAGGGGDDLGGGDGTRNHVFVERNLAGIDARGDRGGIEGVESVDAIVQPTQGIAFAGDLRDTVLFVIGVGRVGSDLEVTGVIDVGQLCPDVDKVVVYPVDALVLGAGAEESAAVGSTGLGAGLVIRVDGEADGLADSATLRQIVHVTTREQQYHRKYIQNSFHIANVNGFEKTMQVIKCHGNLQFRRRYFSIFCVHLQKDCSLCPSTKPYSLTLTRL